MGLGYGRGSIARAEPANLVVIEADSSVLEASLPLPLAGRRLRLAPTGGGGYAGSVTAADAVAPRGKLLRFPPGGEAVHVRLQQAVVLYGVEYRDLYVHPHGAVTLGEPFASTVRADASSPGALEDGLLSGPAVVAPFWNELRVERPIPGGGVFLAQWGGETTITWTGIPSVRPADAPNTFRVVFRADRSIDLEYGAMSSTWGVVGLAPPALDRSGVSSVDFAAPTIVAPAQAALARYRDRPVLNEIALARRVYERVPDRFEFMTVLSTVPVDGPHLVYSSTVQNREEGIALPVFDQSALFGSRRLEHVVFLNDVSLWNEDPAARPKSDGYAFAESALAVLAHETGHRWLSHLPAPLCSGDGHWSYYLESGASLMGGHRLRQNPDGSFTSIGALEGFSSLDLYLMGLLPASEVEPFFSVDAPREFRSESGAAETAPLAGSRPRLGVSFAGERRDHSIAELVSRLGPRLPQAESQSFRMLFVLVAPPGSEPTTSELAQVERLRRAFGPYFRRATRGKARMSTRIPPMVEAPEVVPDPLLEAGVPRILDARRLEADDDRPAMEIDFADFNGDVAALEVGTDATADLPPSRLALEAETQGARRGTITLTLRDLPADATELRLALEDELGQRSAVFAWPLAGR